jgi:hypothetical protein
MDYRRRNQAVADQQRQETMNMVKGFFDRSALPSLAAATGTPIVREWILPRTHWIARRQRSISCWRNSKQNLRRLQLATDKYVAAAKDHFGKAADIDRLRIHVKDNIIYYMQAIWTYEPPDQRYFRLYDIDVPVFSHNTTVAVAAEESSRALIYGALDNSMSHIAARHFPLL